MNCKKGIVIISLIILIIFIIKRYNISLIIDDIIKPKICPNYHKLGDSYFNGSYEIKPNYIKAMENYHRVFMYDPDNENIPQIRKNLNTIITNTTDNDELNNIQTINQIFIEDLEFGLQNDINDYIININFDNIPIDEPPHNGFDFNNNFENNNENIQYYNDFQNVHDSLVNKTVNSSIKKLEDTTNQKNTLDEINKYLLTNLNKTTLPVEEKDKIKKTINYIKNNSNAKINDRKLQDNLILVGNRIKNTTDNNIQNDMLNNLYQELRDCVRSDDNMYCLTGISNRIINSLNGIDDDVYITPKWSLREEMMRKCGQIREELEKNKSQEDDDFNKILQENIKSKLKQEYVINNKILKEDDFNKEINEWIEYI